MNSVPTTRLIRETLAECRRRIAEVVAREAQLERDLAKRRASSTRAAEQAMALQAGEGGRQRQELETSQREALARIKLRFEARAARIRTAGADCRRRSDQLIDRQDGREVFGFQKATLDSEKRRDAELMAAEEAFAAVSADVARGRELLAGKEATIRSLLAPFGSFRRRLSPAFPWPAPAPGADEHECLHRVGEALAELDELTPRLRRLILPSLARLFPAWLVCLLLAAATAGAVFGLPALGRPALNAGVAGAGAAGVFAMFLVFRLAAWRQARPLGEQAVRHVANLRAWLSAAADKAETRHRAEGLRIQAEYAETNRSIRERWAWHDESVTVKRSNARQALDAKIERATARHQRAQEAALARLARRHTEETRAAEMETQARRSRITEAARVEADRLNTESAAARAALKAEWAAAVEPCAGLLSTAAAEPPAREWSPELWKGWSPPAEYAEPPKIGVLNFEVRALAPKWPLDPGLTFPGPERRSTPLWLAYPDEGAVVLETDKTGADEAGAALNNMAYRLLCSLPPGRLRVTVLDPAGLGKTFASLMHLADYTEGQGGAGQRIWTESGQIEQRLAELTEHLEKVIQMYLRNEFANLVEYNARAGSVAERHHLLLVSGFPVNFSDSAARRLLNLISNGGRCGIITLLHWDRRHPVPAGFTVEELRAAGVHLVHTGSGFAAAPTFGAGVRLTLGAPPAPELATDLLHRIGRASRDANKVEVPFEVVAPAPGDLWRESTINEIRVPIGRTGASKLQYLDLGRGTRQHALISGKTGSGKSNLLHVLVTNLALRCSPGEIEFYLVDFKKGVEFKAYATARLPHARVVAIESDREFGLSVLERLDEELRRRGELFRGLGVQDVPGYRGAGGREPMPRCLLLVDEFQEYFTQEDRISQNAAALLDRIVRQGRAFGVHVILASQTLGGAYALARATLGQMAVRIAFQCDEADAYLIMGDENPAPRLLSRPGEGIYNDAAGALEANSPFQAVWLPDDEREERLEAIRSRAAGSSWAGAAPVVYEGSAPANLADNQELGRLLAAPPAAPPPFPTVWLGAPNSIKGPTAAVFPRSGGGNLLIVGQRDESTLALAAAAIISLVAQHPPGLARIILVDTTPPGAPRGEMLARLASALPRGVERVPPAELPGTLAALAVDLDARAADPAQPKPSTFLLLVGLQNCKKLKQDDGFGFSSDPGDSAANPSATFQRLYVDGPAAGIHTIAIVDSYNNVSRFLGRKGLSEFEMRVLLQMSASDSSSLVDQPGAAGLGLYGALYYNDREGWLETFRPYSPPEGGWLAAALASLQPARSRPTDPATGGSEASPRLPAAFAPPKLDA